MIALGYKFTVITFILAVVGMAKPTNNINFKYEKLLVKRTPTMANFENVISKVLA